MKSEHTRFGIGPQGSQALADQLQSQLSTNPGDIVAMHNLSVELRMLGRSDEALALAERAWNAGLHLPETATTRGHDLIDLGRLDEAADAFRQAIAIDPAHVAAHEALAALLPQIGASGAAFDSYEAALQRAPDSVALWSSAFAIANAQHRFALLARWCGAALARFGGDPVIRGYLACSQIGLGDLSAARETIDKVVKDAPGYAAGHLIRARILLTLGDPAGAAQAAEAALALDSHNQLGWTLQGTAWRMLGDPREVWLCDYERLVMPLAVDLPTAIADRLDQLHQAGSDPAEQSLRGGTQTAGNLFQARDPLVIELAVRLHKRITEHLATLPEDPAHPFLSRNTREIAFSASWSVKLKDQGFHVPHIHPAGWLSSAVYIALPDSVSNGSGEGVLSFGMPEASLGLDLPPQHTVQPREGELVLFPSYMWHGTAPFHSDQPRMTVAFDALPLGAGTG